MNESKKRKQLLQNVRGILLEDQPLSVNEMLKKWSIFLKDNSKIITDVYRIIQYNDEPTFDHFHADVNISSKQKYFGLDGEGFSFSSADLALLKCLGEAAERISTFEQNNPVVSVSLKEIIHEHIPFLDPRTVVGVWEQVWDSEQVMNWVQGWDVLTQSPIAVPAQLVWISSARHQNEQLIYPPISTGAASHSCLSVAIYQGICECIERDAYMITYLKKLPRQRIDLTSHPELKSLQEKAERYQLEIAVFEITTDIPVPAFMALAIDRTGFGPAVTIGLKADLDPLAAISGAIEESFHPRNWLRAKHEDGVKEGEELNNLEQRGLYWYDKKMLKHLDFLFDKKSSMKKLNEFDLSEWTAQKKFKSIRKMLEQFQLRTYVVETTHPELQPLGIRVVKVIMPDLQPLYLQEKYRVWTGKRLESVPEKLGYKNINTEINPIPHPFL